MITSQANEKVRYVRSLQRRRVRQAEGRFLAEGVRLIEEATRAGYTPALTFYTQGLTQTERGPALLASLQQLTSEVYPVSEAIMRSVADTVTPQGILAVLPFIQLPFPPQPQLILVVDAVQDPGNLGLILRTAEAAGVDGVLLAPRSVDLYNPKVVRAAMGAHFRLPVLSAGWREIEERLPVGPVYLADPRAERACYDVDWTQPSTLIIGSEARGSGPKARQLATTGIAVPMPGEAESLNVAVAAGVILFEAVRQRSLYQGVNRRSSGGWPG